MNVSQSLLRLWVVISILWITCSAIIAISELRNNAAKPVSVNYPTLSLPYPGTDRGNSKLQAANEAAVAAAKAAKAAAVAPDSKYQMLLSIDADVKADAAAEAAGIPKVTQGLNMGQARAALAAALVPPLALLTLGLAIRWVVAGLKT